MNTPLSWIKAYVPGLACTDQEYSDKMTLSGTKVEGFKRLDKNLENIVVGKILSIEKHPDADKLVVCQVDVGKEQPVQIVTGARNMVEGDVVPVVLDGGRVAGGHDGSPLPENGIKIKAGKLRGVESNGMLCSVEELGSSRDFYPEAPEDGIYEITSNRVDCYSILGVAREAAATFDLPFEAPEVTVEEGPLKTADMVSVEIKDPDLCSRYCARVCTDVKIAPSPAWMQRRLAAAGIRPINNLVDITNYVMLEYGQPMHAFDLDHVAGHKIIVRRAADGDIFQTLDGQDRKLDSDVLMICDAEKEIGIAGIMGGENSKITDEVKTVLFEAATFNGTNIRRSSRRIGLRTDASGTFEKGLDPVNAEDAINRACQLMVELGCGMPAQGMVDVKSPIRPLTRIPFNADEINRYLEESGKRICYPVCKKGGIMEAVIPGAENTQAWRRGAFGIREPVPEKALPVAPEEIDAVIVPCVVFDRRGGRCGHGAGYYDRFLGKLSPEIPKILVAFDCQQAPAVVEEETDVDMDFVVTESGIRYRS